MLLCGFSFAFLRGNPVQFSDQLVQFSDTILRKIENLRFFSVFSAALHLHVVVDRYTFKIEDHVANLEFFRY